MTIISDASNNIKVKCFIQKTKNITSISMYDEL